MESARHITHNPDVTRVQSDGLRLFAAFARSKIPAYVQAPAGLTCKNTSVVRSLTLVAKYRYGLTLPLVHLRNPPPIVAQLGEVRSIFWREASIIGLLFDCLVGQL